MKKGSEKKDARIMLYAGRIPCAEMSDQVDQSYERQYRRCIAGAWGVICKRPRQNSVKFHYILCPGKAKGVLWKESY